MTVFLTLGDGDFSYSLDLIRYLRNNTKQQLLARNHVIVSGIDSLEEFQKKYKDYDFLLRQLSRISTNGVTRNAQMDNLTIEIRHEVNAVSASHHPSLPTKKAHVVIFNHPHLGIEDAARHGRFIHHFLYECNSSWLNESGNNSHQSEGTEAATTATATVHLTLAVGQWERWNGHAAMVKQGFCLKHRLPFLPPPVEAPKYQYRRHQSGKSFRKRTLGSETFVLTRKTFEDEEAFLFDWQVTKRDVDGVKQLKLSDPPPNIHPFKCPSCERTFREERSLQSHLQVVHDDRMKRHCFDRDITCEHCNSLNIVKSYLNIQALSDHVRAKHTGVHKTTIQPSWAKKEEKLLYMNSCSYGRCKICDFVFFSAEDVRRHAEEFLPSLDENSDLSYLCQFCGKVFNDERAQLQHENFCNPSQDITLSSG